MRLEKYETPEMEIVSLGESDIIVTSTDTRSLSEYSAWKE